MKHNIYAGGYNTCFAIERNGICGTVYGGISRISYLEGCKCEEPDTSRYKYCIGEGKISYVEQGRWDIDNSQSVHVKLLACNPLDA